VVYLLMRLMAYGRGCEGKPTVRNLRGTMEVALGKAPGRFSRVVSTGTDRRRCLVRLARNWKSHLIYDARRIRIKRTAWSYKLERSRLNIKIESYWELLEEDKWTFLQSVILWIVDRRHRKGRKMRIIGLPAILELLSQGGQDEPDAEVEEVGGRRRTGRRRSRRHRSRRRRTRR
jgi:hypothetical protein